MFVSTQLHKDAGLIRELTPGSGNFRLTKNAKRRLVCLYGDALSVNNYTKVPLRSARQLTHLGSPNATRMINDMVESFDSVVIQKGLFHQLMHQCEVIYS